MEPSPQSGDVLNDAAEENTANRQTGVTRSTPLHRLIKKNNTVCLCKSCNKQNGSSENLSEEIKELIEKGAEQFRKEINGDTPLHTAVLQNENEDVLEALIETKHNKNKCENCTCGQEVLKMKNNSGKTPRQFEYASEKTLKLLSMKGKINYLNLRIYSINIHNIIYNNYTEQ